MGFYGSSNLLLETGGPLLLEDGVGTLGLEPEIPVELVATVTWEMGSLAVLREPSIVRINDGPGGSPGWSLSATANLSNPFLRIVTAAVGWEIGAEANLNLQRTSTISEFDVGWSIAAPTSLAILKDVEISAEVGWAIGAEADLQVLQIPGLVVNATWAIGAPTRLTVSYGGTPPVRVETIDSRLLGAVGVCHGPFDTAIVAASEARSITMLNLRDPVSLPVLGSWHVGGRPVAIGSRGFRRTDPLVFVLVEREELPNKSCQLQVWGLVGGRFAERGSVDLPGQVAWALACPDDAGTASLWNRDEMDFVVVATMTGLVKIFSADDSLVLIAELQTGVYQPRVATVVANQALDRQKSGATP